MALGGCATLRSFVDFSETDLEGSTRLLHGSSIARARSGGDIVGEGFLATLEKQFSPSTHDAYLLKAALHSGLGTQSVNQLGMPKRTADGLQASYGEYQPSTSEASAFWIQRISDEIAKRTQGSLPSQLQQQKTKSISGPMAAIHPRSGLAGHTLHRRPSVGSRAKSASDGRSSRTEGSMESTTEMDGVFAMMSAKSARTTLMIRNVPVLYSSELLFAEWQNEGTYDFLYLPYSCNTQRNLSYCFMNFTSEASAIAFVRRWQNRRLAHYTSRKPLNISFADVQGFDANLWELKKKRMMRIKVPQCQPMIFNRYGELVDLMDALNHLELKASRQPFFGDGVTVLSL